MIIFSPGPANISEKVRKALTKPDICHRDAEFEGLLDSTRRMLLEALNISGGREPIIFGGSGTTAIEAVISSFGGYGKNILVISNGIYGERAAAIARMYDIKIEEIRMKWGQLPNLASVRNKLQSDKFGAVYIVHHETTTGLLNPLRDIAAIGRRYGKLVLTDAVSSIAGENLDITGWGVDAAIGSANKCIRAVAGISFVIASPNFIKTVKKCHSRSYCADLLLHQRMESERQQTPFTPPVQAFYAFKEALKGLKREGVDNRIKKYKETACLLREGLKKIGVKLFLPEDLMSNTMTVVYTPQGKAYSTLHSELKKRGFVIYASQGILSKNTFRLGTVGIITKKDIERFLAIFKDLA